MRYDGSRYDVGDDFAIGRKVLTPEEVDNVQRLLTQNINPQISHPQIGADQNNFPLSSDVLQRLTTDASRTITGFANPTPGLKIIANAGAQNIVLAHENASSTAANRISCHTGANITLNTLERVHIIYDFTAARWLTIGFI